MKIVNDEVKELLACPVLTASEAARIRDAMRGQPHPTFPYEREMFAPLEFINAKPGDELKRGDDSYVVFASKIESGKELRLTLTLGSKSDSLFNLESLAGFELVGR